MKFFIEAVGGLTSGYLIKAIKESGNSVTGSDINADNHGRYLCDDFAVVPPYSDLHLWEKMEKILKEKNIDVVIPSFDETLLGWAKIKEDFANKKISVIVSPIETIEIFQDKWKTYEFFVSIGIPVPKTSLSEEYGLIKPRQGRGSVGIFDKPEGVPVDMEGRISQEKIIGEEYTIDTFFSIDGEPIYIVPRKRIAVREGKSTGGRVIKNTHMENLITTIAKHIRFVGPINFQLILTASGDILFIEVNPRIAGGMALGFAATENWIKLIIENLIKRNQIIPKKICYGMQMFRYYAECFI